MADIELLLMPDHAVRQRLQMTPDAAKTKHAETKTWLKGYFLDKYQIAADDYADSDDFTALVNSLQRSSYEID